MLSATYYLHVTLQHPGLQSLTPSLPCGPAVSCCLPFKPVCCSEEVSRARLNTLRGLGDHARVDEQLYHDYESEDARKVRHSGVNLQQYHVGCKPIAAGSTMAVMLCLLLAVTGHDMSCLQERLAKEVKEKQS